MSKKDSYYKRNRTKVLRKRRKHYIENRNAISRKNAMWSKAKTSRLAIALHEKLKGKCSRCDLFVAVSASYINNGETTTTIHQYIRKGSVGKPKLVCSNCYVGGNSLPSFMLGDTK